MNSTRSVARSCALVAVLLATLADAATLTVMSAADSGGTCPGVTCTLRQAIASAAQTDTIDFAAAISVISLTSGELSINKNVTIKGPGADRLTIQRSFAAGVPLFRVMSVVSGAGSYVFISGLTLSNGSAAEGGGIFANAGVTYLSDCAVTGNHATQAGGGVRNLFGHLHLTNCTVSGNGSDAAGGGVSNGSFPTYIFGSTISGNSAVTGAGINIGGFFHISNSTITDNHASGSGGGIRVDFGTPDIKSSIVALNTAVGSSPDLYNPATSIASNGFNLIGNGAGGNLVTTATDKVGTGAAPINPQLGVLQYNGGATKTHALLSGSPAIEAGQADGSSVDQRGFARPVDSTAVGNAAGGDGSDIGAFEMQADQLPGCSTVNRIVTNGNDSGADSLRDVISKVCAGSIVTFAPNVSLVTLTTGELVVNKPLTINGPGADLLSVQRSAAGGTANFRVFNVTTLFNVKITGLSVSNGNSPGQQGGGIRNAGILALSGVAVAGNNAGPGGAGGGIYNAGTLTITGSTLSGNSVTGIVAGSGGAIFNFGGALTLINSTLSGNTAVGPGANTDSGGGIYSNVGTVLLINSTITDNTGDIGGGVRGSNGAVVTARNSIIALNHSANGPDVNGLLISQGFNIIGDFSGMTISPSLLSDQLGVSAGQLQLDSLQFNGGRTRTHALLLGSFAIDKGQSSIQVTDQRGKPRPILTGPVAVADGDGSDIGAFELAPASLDIDGDGVYGPLTDGILILRYLSGLTGPSLTDGAIGASAIRHTPEAVFNYLDGIKSALDVDGNNQLDPLTDGLMLIRYLSTVRGTPLTAGVLGANSTRTTPEIETYIQSLMP